MGFRAKYVEHCKDLIENLKKQYAGSVTFELNDYEVIVKKVVRNNSLRNSNRSRKNYDSRFRLFKKDSFPKNETTEHYKAVDDSDEEFFGYRKPVYYQRGRRNIVSNEDLGIVIHDPNAKDREEGCCSCIIQ